MGCGCGGNAGRRLTQVPQMPARNNAIADNASTLHPSVVKMQNVQRLAEEKRKIGRLNRERLLKALSRP
jgi:hypothetical protein